MRTTAWMFPVLALATGSGPLAASVADEDSAVLTLSSQSWSRWQGRLSLGSNATVGQIGTASLSDRRRSASLMGDYYFGRSLAGIGNSGGFRVTSGLIFGPRGLLATGQPALGAGNSVSFGSALPRSPATWGLGDPGTDFATLPYLGLGYTGLSARRGWSFSADLGLVGGSASNAARLGRNGYGQNLDEMVHDLRAAPLAPLLQVGMIYAF